LTGLRSRHFRLRLSHSLRQPPLACITSTATPSISGIVKTRMS
jgi:hypothetical protein